MGLLGEIKSVPIQTQNGVSSQVSMSGLLKRDCAQEASGDPDKMQILIHTFPTSSKVTLKLLVPSNPYLGLQAPVLRCATFSYAV